MIVVHIVSFFLLNPLLHTNSCNCCPYCFFFCRQQLERKEIELKHKGLITSPAVQSELAAGNVGATGAVLGAGQIAQLQAQLKQAKVRHATVQTCNSWASRPGVCQCLVVQTPMDNMSKYKPSISMTQVVCESKLRSIL